MSFICFRMLELLFSFSFVRLHHYALSLSCVEMSCCEDVLKVGSLARLLGRHESGEIFYDVVKHSSIQVCFCNPTPVTGHLPSYNNQRDDMILVVTTHVNSEPLWRHLILDLFIAAHNS